MVAYRKRGRIFHAYWRGENGKIESKTLETDDGNIARKKAVKIQDELDEKRKGVYGKLPWTTFKQEYLEWARTNKVQESYLRDVITLQHFDKHSRPETVKDLTPKMLEDYKTKRKDTPYREGKISEATINRELNTLKGMAAKAVEWNYLETDPWKGVSKFTIDKKIPLHFIGKEKAIRNACDDTYDLVLYDLNINEGLRRGEMANLKREDINLDTMEMKVVSTMGRRTKPKRERFVQLNRETVKDLRKLFKESREEYVLGRNGERTPPVYLTRRWKRFLKWAGNLEGHLHLGRHTLGTKLVRKTDMITARDALGHSSVTTTQIYTHSDKAAQRAAKDRI